MSNVAKLKKRALEFEQKKQFEKALDTYVLVLAELDEHIDEADVALYNRVGDLLLRKGDVSEAVDHYEKAVDLYTDGGFFNNAIALCNKILRNAPGRNSVYYKLGKISAQKGFINDAKQNFLEYADRMQRGGQLEEAFRALKEFADLCPDQDDIRLMLADQLVKRDRKDEAIEQLQALYDKFSSEGRAKEARATVDRMKAIDETLEPTAGASRPTPRANDLVFLDVEYDTGAPKKGPGRASKTATPAPKAEKERPTPAPKAATPGDVAEPAAKGKRDTEPVPEIDLPLLEVPSGDTPAAGTTAAGRSPPSAVTVDPNASADLVSHIDSGLITGFEQTSITTRDDREKAPIERLAGLESTTPSEGAAATAEDSLADLPMLDVDEEPKGKTLPPGLPSFDPNATARATSGLTLIMPDDPVPARASTKKDKEKEKGKGKDVAPPPAEPTAPPPAAAAKQAGTPSKGQMPAEAKSRATPAPEPRPTKAQKRRTPSRHTDLRGLEDEDESVIDAAFSSGIGSAVEELRERVLRESENWVLRREFGEALLENGERSAGLKALEESMGGFERAGEYGGATSIAEELLRVDPNSVRYHQKRVEYAVRASDRPRLVDAYLALAECLFRSGQLDKSKAVYGRVVELAPEDPRARSALREAFGTRELPAVLPTKPADAAIADSAANGVPPRAPAGPPADRRRTSGDFAVRGGGPPADRRRGDPSREGARASSAPTEPPAKRPATPRRESFVNLSDWLKDDEPEPSASPAAAGATAGHPSGDQGGFAEMLSKFKQGVAASVDETDHESHYDLGVAYKEMGLLDEAISQFQKALRGTEQRVRTYEALGQCFVEKRQYQIALTILSRALNDKTLSDDTLVGVLYLLGYASESLGQVAEALKYYERVFAVDIQFRDIGDRLVATERKVR